MSREPAEHRCRRGSSFPHLLGLELADPSFDASVLSEFRSRLVAGGAEELLVDTLQGLCREQNLLVARGRQRTGSTHGLGAVRSLNRLSGGAAAVCSAVGSPRGDSVRHRSAAGGAERPGHRGP